MENTYVINPWLFYLISLLDDLKGFGFIIGFIALISFAISYIIISAEEFRYDDESYRATHKALKYTFIVGVIGCVLWIVIPSQETCYKMLIAQNITKQTLITTSEAFNDLINKAVDKIIKNQNSKR